MGVKVRIGIDIDDTITYTYEMLLPMVAVRYGVSLSKLYEEVPTYKKLDKMFPDDAHFVSESLPVCAKLTPVREGALEVIRKLKEEGHEIFFITARNPQEFVEPYKISYDFLKVNDVPYDKLFVNVQRKDQQCLVENIDLFIDDNNNNCRAVHKAGIETLQFGTIFTKKLKNIERVESWQDVYNFVKNKETKN